MGKLKPIKTLQKHSNVNDSLYDLTETKPFDPVLSRISQKSLLVMFENDLTFSLKAIKFNTSSNHQKLLNIDIFLNAWKKYGSYLPTLLYATRLVESGEELLLSKGYHNLANLHCFDRILDSNQIQGIEMERLMIRAKYGRVMVGYIQILSMDPLVKSPIAITSVENLLSELIEIVDECNKKEELAGLILTGSYHIRNICNHLIENKCFSLTADFLAKSLNYLKNNVELMGAEFLPWFIDNVKILYNALLNLSKIKEANNMILETITMIRYIEQLEKEAKYSDILPSKLQEEIQSALYDMNLVLFGCEIRALASIMYTGTTQESAYHHITDHGDIGEDTRLSPICSTTIGKTSTQITTILEGQIVRLCGKSSYRSLYKINYDSCTILFQENLTYTREFKKMTDSYVTENNIEVEKGFETTEDEDAGSYEKKEDAGVEELKRRSGRREKQENTEEIKSKRKEFLQLINRLQMFTDDRGKLAAINSALHNLGVDGHSLFTYEKNSESILENWIKQLINLGFHLLSSTPASLDGRVMTKKITECKKGKLTSIKSIPKPAYLDRFDLKNVVSFSRYLYVQEYWGYFLRVSMNNNDLASIHEFSLRIQCINFDISYHAERIVGFEYSQQDITKSLIDLKKRRQKVGKSVEISLIGFLQELCICLENDIYRSEVSFLLADASYILWRFTEPYFVDLDSSSTNICVEKIIFLAINAAHVISSQICNHSNLAVSISGTLALFLELKGQFNESIEILLGAIERIKLLQLRLGENGSPFINSLLEEKSIDSQYQGAMLTKSLACYHVELLQGYYRCFIKLNHLKTMEEVRNKEGQYFRLTQKKITISPPFDADDVDKFLKLVCRESYSHRSIFLQVFATTATHYHLDIRKKSIILSYKYLQQAVEYEEFLKQKNMENNINQLSLAYRSHNCIALKVRSNKNRTTVKLFCGKKSVNKMVSITNTKFAGTGETILLGLNNQQLIIIEGLKENTLYEISGTLHDWTYNTSMTTDRISIITGNILPLVLCWENFSLTAPSLGYLRLGINGLKFLWSYFVDSPFRSKNSIENGLPKKPAMLKRANIDRENPILLDNFVRVIFHINDEEYLQILGSYLEDLKDHSRYYLLIDFRFRAIERLLTALNICKLTDNLSFELKGAVCCFNHTDSFLKTNSETTESIDIFLFLHSSMIASISSLENSRTQGIIDYVIPVTLHLIKLLTKLNMYDQIMKICSEVLELLHRFCVLSDPKIKNNADEKFGRSLVAPDSNLKNLNTSHEFLHHEYLAVSNRWKTGYTIKKTQLDQFCEYLDSQIVICCFRLPFSLDNSLVSDLLRKELSRRTLDSQPTMKEIQILYQNIQSPDIVFHEALKLRNHPRFIEIASKIANWAISTNSFEQASKICGQIEDWCSKRNLILTTIDLSPEEYQKWEAAIKRKQPLKTNKQSEKQEKRGRSRRAKKKGSGAKTTKISSTSKPAENSTDRDSSSSRERKERSVSPESKPSMVRRISYSGSKVLETSTDESEIKNSYIAYRRRKITFKQQYLEGLTPDMKIKMDKAVKVLDRHLSSLWYRFRIRRRLTCILRFEASSRIDISLIHAESLFGTLKRDLIQKGFVKKETLQAGVSIPKDDLVNYDEKNSTIPNVLLNTIKDSFQHFTFGINLATRNGSWIQLLSGVKQIQNSYQYLAFLGIFNSDNWNDRLSRWFYLVADDVCDFFQTVDVAMETSIKPLSPLTLQYMKAPDYKRRFPVKSREDIYNYSWNIYYKDGSGLIHAEKMEITSILQFLQTTLEIMSFSKKTYRLNLLLNRLNHIFYGCQLFLSYRNDTIAGIKNSYTLLHNARSLQGQNQIDMYENSILKANEEGCLTNEITGLNELGDTLILNNQVKDAAKNWMKCINTVFHDENILIKWPDIFFYDDKSDRLLGMYQTSIKILQVTKNVKLSIFMGLVIAKLAYHQYFKSDESKNHIILLALGCLLAPFNIIPPRPSTYVEFTLWETDYFADILEKFTLTYRYQSHLILDQILWMINYCNSSHLSDLVLPLNCYIKHITKRVNLSTIYRSINQSGEIQALQNINLSNHAFSILKNMKYEGDSISPIFSSEPILNKTTLEELLDTSHAENLSGIYSQELIAISKVRFILNYLRVSERTEYGIQQAKSYVLEKVKKIYSLKLQYKGLEKLFYERAEICWDLLLGDLCILENNIGIGIKWYFTAMDGIHKYLANNCSLQTIEYGFTRLTHLRHMILEKTIRGFLSLRYFDVANHMAQTARKEAESNGMKLKAAVFYSLESVSHSSSNSGTLPPPSEWLQYVHDHNIEIYLTALELMSDHNDVFNPDPLSELILIVKKYPTKKEDLLRLCMKRFLILRLQSELGSIQPLFLEIQNLFISFECTKGLYRNYMLLNVRNLVDLAQSHPQSDLDHLVQSKHDLLQFLSKLLQETSFSYGHIRECFLLISSIEAIQNILPTKWLYLATKLSIFRAHHKLQRTLPFDLKVGNIPLATLYDLDLFHRNSTPSNNGQLLPNPLENNHLENVLKFSDILQAVPEVNISEQTIFEVVNILEEELLNPYQPVNDPWKIACQERLGQLVSFADSDYKWGLEPSLMDATKISAEFYCIQWLETRQPLNEKSLLNQANLYKLYFCVSDQTIIHSRSLVCKSALKSLLERTKALLAALQRSSQVPDGNFNSKITDTWNSTLKTFISFFSEDERIEDIKCLEPKTIFVECLIKALDTSQGFGYGGDLCALITDPESSRLFFEWLLTTITFLRSGIINQ